MRLRHRVVVALLLAAALPGIALPRDLSLDAWLAVELTPYLAEQLRTHPRFKDQSLRFVVLANGIPQATSNALAIDIRDQLREVASGVPGVRLAWQPDDPHALRHAGPGGVDCTKSEVHYLIGVELNLTDRGLLDVEVRALDAEDGTAVPGFGRSWKGPVSSQQYRDLRRVSGDPTFRGQREVPYDATQTDLLAARLAHDLGCDLLRQTEAEYVVAHTAGVDNAAPGLNLVELVSNNLAKYNALQITSAGDAANAVIEGKAHRIDADLYQYWITVNPRDALNDQHALSASAYIMLPERFALAEAYAGETDAVPANDAGYIASLKIVDIGEPQVCHGVAGRRNADCFALSLSSEHDAVVYFLHHQLNHGLVRLGDPSCTQSDSARVVKSRQQLQFPLPADALPSAAWAAADSWPANPELDTYVAIAASSSAAARALSRHIRQLPKRCSASVRPGLDGFALRQWLDELARMIDKWEPALDWRAIRVKNVF